MIFPSTTRFSNITEWTCGINKRKKFGWNLELSFLSQCPQVKPTDSDDNWTLLLIKIMRCDQKLHKVVRLFRSKTNIRIFPPLVSSQHYYDRNCAVLPTQVDRSTVFCPLCDSFLQLFVSFFFSGPHLAQLWLRQTNICSKLVLKDHICIAYHRSITSCPAVIFCWRLRKSMS